MPGVTNWKTLSVLHVETSLFKIESSYPGKEKGAGTRSHQDHRQTSDTHAAVLGWEVVFHIEGRAAKASDRPLFCSNGRNLIVRDCFSRVTSVS